MRLHLNNNLTIENLKRYPEDIVEKLRNLLVTGTEALPDPRRRGFYDVLNGNRVFFIHISPVSGNVMLLASWLKERPAAAARSDASGERAS
ncbi:MAG: hypothetical protein DMG25_13945 [Acidobacteria bacterium]|nr:MAG: hypothetical protein DMG25_13945 [Acidobacteriota bacterium]